MRLTTHLTLEELACRDGTPYPPEWVEDRAKKLAWSFEVIRANASLILRGDDCPITILSAYRTPSWNRKVGGARNSYHVKGMALDLKTPQKFVKQFGSKALDKFWVMIYGIAYHVADIRGLGRYPWGVHIDIRQTTHLVVFKGVRPKAELEV